MPEPIPFKAFRTLETSDGFQRQLAIRYTHELPEGDVLIRVHYSSLNYKDALSASGHKGITRTYPHTPGIDAAGIVVHSEAAGISEGQEVIVTSYDLGMNTDGGFGEYIRVPAEWVVPLPEGLDLRRSMVLGTAGFTAGLSLYKMERCGLDPGDGPVVVTGASGGVGSIAVMLLARRGYEVWAVSGSPEAHDRLRQLGATKILSREQVSDDSGRPLLKSQWAGAIDTVGGNTLATLVKACKREGSVAVCGLVGSHELSLTVYPFILNGVNLLGIDSATCPMELRRRIWDLLAGGWAFELPDSMITDITLEQLDPYIDQILAGNTTGRIVVHLSSS